MAISISRLLYEELSIYFFSFFFQRSVLQLIINATEQKMKHSHFHQRLTEKDGKTLEKTILTHWIYPISCQFFQSRMCLFISPSKQTKVLFNEWQIISIEKASKGSSICGNSGFQGPLIPHKSTLLFDSPLPGIKGGSSMRPPQITLLWFKISQIPICWQKLTLDGTSTFAIILIAWRIRLVPSSLSKLLLQPASLYTTLLTKLD